MFLGFTVLAPLGGYLSNYLGALFTFLSDKVGPLALGVLTGFLRGSSCAACTRHLVHS